MDNELKGICCRNGKDRFGKWHIKLGINKDYFDYFEENGFFNNYGWLNLIIKKTKSGRPYVEFDDFYGIENQPKIYGIKRSV